MDDFDEMAAAIVGINRDSRHPDHVHQCHSANGDEMCESLCECECGAVLAMGATYAQDGRWVWRLPDGTEAPFPDPRLRDEDRP